MKTALLILVAATIVACQQKCEDDPDCPSGQLCSRNVCVPAIKPGAG
ncbi:hypothetical protein OESDEN_17057 [Oesophagostomum dentatum]|uniref:WAP domain-containing protein n=1 Tax=Oesophagostomum dentatum TaxID=61180 RepID=A0A0B1SH85_OESDE|nr:hypothetical protein OESDEN_17057 [Oesophagostomum dentatum]